MTGNTLTVACTAWITVVILVVHFASPSAPEPAAPGNLDWPKTVSTDIRTVEEAVSDLHRLVEGLAVSRQPTTAGENGEPLSSQESEAGIRSMLDAMATIQSQLNRLLDVAGLEKARQLSERARSAAPCSSASVAHLLDLAASNGSVSLTRDHILWSAADVLTTYGRPKIVRPTSLGYTEWVMLDDDDHGKVVFRLLDGMVILPQKSGHPDRSQKAPKG